MLFFISFLSGTVLFYLSRFFPLTTAVFFFSASALFMIRKRPFLILAVVAGFMIAMIRYVPSEGPDIPPDREMSVTGRFVPRKNAPGKESQVLSFLVESAVDTASGREMAELENTTVAIFSEVTPDFRKSYELLLRAGPDRLRLNPGSPVSRGLSASIITGQEENDAPPPVLQRLRLARHDLNTHVSERFDSDSAGLVASITTGDRAYLEPALRNSFNRTGLAHLLSISGTHFGLFSVILFGGFTFLIKLLPYRILQRLTVYLTPAQAAAVLCAPFMLMYLALSGGSIPALRSFIMISIVLAGLLLGRKGAWLNSLLAAAFILVLWDPAVVMSVSFQLSFTAVVFIGYALERKDDDDQLPDKNEGSRLLNYLRNAFVLTIAASLGTAPLVAYYFHYSSLIAPVANLVAAPLIGFVLIPLAVISSFSYVLSGFYLFSPLVSIVADVSVFVVKRFAEIPHADTAIPAFPPILCIFFYGAFLVYAVAGRRRIMIGLPFVPLVIYALVRVASPGALSVTYLDVGQGDSAVIELPDGRVLVSDTGRSGYETASFLRYRGKRTVDALILSHIHPDHAGGLSHILQTFDVKEVWDNGRMEYPEGLIKGRPHRKLERGDIAEEGSYSITVLHPYREFYTFNGYEYDEENNSSLVFRLTGRKQSFLFAGDIEEEAEEDLVHLNQLLQASVLKVPHHGSVTSAGETFIRSVSPSVAVISAGRNNPFGHPSREVLEQLDASKVVRTDRDGAIKVMETDDGLVVKTYRDFSLQQADGLSAEWNNIKKLSSTW